MHSSIFLMVIVNVNILLVCLFKPTNLEAFESGLFFYTILLTLTFLILIILATKDMHEKAE
jgi:hypothetical protein